MEVSERSREPFHMQGGKTGCLLLHGFAGSPAEMEPFGKSLAAAGLTVFCPVLAGHRDPAHMCGAGWEEWLGTARAALAMLMREALEVFLVGFSLGGLIAFDLAASEPVAGVVSVNSPLKLSSTQVLRAHLLKVSGDGSRDDLELESRVPMSCLSSLYDYAARVAGLLPQVSAPALILQARQDEAVDPKDARAIYDSLGSKHKSLVWVDDAGHLAVLGAQRDVVFKTARDFIEQTSKHHRGDGIA